MSKKRSKLDLGLDDEERGELLQFSEQELQYFDKHFLDTELQDGFRDFGTMKNLITKDDRIPDEEIKREFMRNALKKGEEYRLKGTLRKEPTSWSEKKASQIVYIGRALYKGKMKHFYSIHQEVIVYKADDVKEFVDKANRVRYRKGKDHVRALEKLVHYDFATFQERQEPDFFHDPMPAEQKEEELQELASSKKFLNLGDIIRMKRDVCRHKALMLHVILTQKGYQLITRKGFLKQPNGKIDRHVWNEVTLPNGKTILIDAMNIVRPGHSILTYLDMNLKELHSFTSETKDIIICPNKHL